MEGVDVEYDMLLPADRYRAQSLGGKGDATRGKFN